jgi:hypothetical protein
MAPSQINLGAVELWVEGPEELLQDQDGDPEDYLYDVPPRT